MIREMKPDEVSTVRDLINSRFKVEITLDALNHTLSCEHCHTYVVDDHRIVAAALVVDDERLCWVAAGERCKGHARNLVGWLIKAHPSLYLYVKQNNYIAISLYESLGFQVTGTREASFRMDLKPRR